eukprot:CAMPEP_0168269464 /NCGR_PEP_ID=MMETSP0141_2-20121125/14333_1 /TAXON_ID=44445 /ORGANISM="Pseudo-nitzschia australis, Strain 10249 10 AB" /LENGTH=295 /DNA_ID=CAMNT_0008210095 /DNA_START=467 /DNA_END=1352 /DNA_ORIENTATION=+
MKKISTSLLFLLQFASGAQGQDCAPIEELGTAALHNLTATFQLYNVDDNDEYTLTIDFKHDEDLPAASNPPLQCDPSIVPPDLADDGLPYFAFRWFYQSVPEKVKKITGIDHISIDYNACGHPPANVFTAQHYDVHIYRITPEFRTCMTCTTVPGAPFCDPAPGAQTTDSGNAFFDWETLPGSTQPRNMPEGFEVDLVAMIPLMGGHFWNMKEQPTNFMSWTEPTWIMGTQPRNMPEGFEVDLVAMIPLMGGHFWNMKEQPTNFMSWTEPTWIMGTYGGSVTNFEPMIPMAFMSG